MALLDFSEYALMTKPFAVRYLNNIWLLRASNISVARIAARQFNAVSEDSVGMVIMTHILVLPRRAPPIRGCTT